MKAETNFLYIKRLWQLLSIFQITLIVHLVLYILTPDVGESAQFRILAIGLFAQAVLTFIVTTWLTPQRLEVWKKHLFPIRHIFLVIALVGLFIFGMMMRHEWVYAHAGIVLGGLFSLVYLTLFADTSIHITSRLTIVFALILGVIFTAVRINALGVFPQIIPTDEPWLLGWPVAWVRGLYPDDLIMFHGGEDVFHYFIPMGIFMQFLGTGFIQGRIYQVLMTLVLMIVAYPLVKRVYDEQTAWLTVLMLFAGSVVVLATTIRHDIGLGILITLSYLVHRIATDSDRKNLHFVAGLIAGFGLFTHYHAIAFGPALLIGLYAPYYVGQIKQGKWLPQREIILFAIGGLIGAGIVFLVQILPQISAVIGVREFRSPAEISGFVTSFFDYIGVLAELSQFEFLLILAGIVGLLIRRTLVDIQIFLLIVLGHIGVSILAAHVTLEYYIIPIAPFYAIAIVTLFTRSLTQLPLHVKGVIATLFIVVSLGFTLGEPFRYVLDGNTLKNAPEPRGIAWVRENVPTGSRIVSDLYYFLWLTDYDFIAVTSYRYVSAEYREQYESAADMWADADPDYFIFDPNIPTYDMQRVYDSGFLESADYKIVARIPGKVTDVLIYGKSNSE